MDFKAILSRLFNLDKDGSDDCIEEVGGEMIGDTGFLSFRHRLRIRKGHSTKHVFLKLSDKSRPEMGQLKELSEQVNARECLFYGTFAPLLERTAAQLGMGSIGLPTVHLEMVMPTGTLIVMEDLGEAGFQLGPAMMNPTEARCVLSSLARVQASFWLTKARLGSPASGLFGPESPLSDGFPLSDSSIASFDGMLPGCFERFRSEFMKHIKCEKQVAIINAYLDDDFLDKSQKVMNSNRNEREIIGITHSELWYNNCMIRRDSNGQPVESRLIDWQFFGIGWLTYDLGPFWITSIDNAIVTQEFMNCVDFYHHTVQSAYESAMAEKFPVSLEQTRQQAVQALVYGVAWVVLQADYLDVFKRMDNMLANVADLIVFFKL